MCSEHKVVSEVDKTKGHIQSLHLYPKVLIKRTYRIRLGHLLIFTTVEYIFFFPLKTRCIFCSDGGIHSGNASTISGDIGSF